MLKKIFKASIYIFILFMLFSGFPRMISETKMEVFASPYTTVFAGKIASSIHSATCNSILLCGACTSCGCGAWSDNIFAPIFGSEPRLEKMYSFCAGNSFIPKSPSGGCLIGGVFTTGVTILGHSTLKYVNTNDGISTNFWCLNQ